MLPSDGLLYGPCGACDVLTVLLLQMRRASWPAAAAVTLLPYVQAVRLPPHSSPPHPLPSIRPATASSCKTCAAASAAAWQPPTCSTTAMCAAGTSRPRRRR